MNLFLSFILAIVIFTVGLCAYIGFIIMLGWIKFELKTKETISDYFKYIARILDK